MAKAPVATPLGAPAHLDGPEWWLMRGSPFSAMATAQKQDGRELLMSRQIRWGELLAQSSASELR